MKKFFLILIIFIGTTGFSQDKTNVSLFLRKDPHSFLKEIDSKSGNLFHQLGHHGPAVENQWFGLRIYFNKKAAIDLYSKSRPGLELESTGWYSTKEQQKSGWGADYYRVGKSVGLGGIKLWNGKKVVPLNPVSKRSAKVAKGGDGSSTMEMISEGIPCKGQKVNILVRVTVYPDSRRAKVEAISQTGVPVQFVTGINYHKGVSIRKSENYLATWGIHPEDVAVDKVAVGAALIFNATDFERQTDDGHQILLISKPAQKIQTWITSANEREPHINTFEKLIQTLNKNE